MSRFVTYFLPLVVIGLATGQVRGLMATTAAAAPVVLVSIEPLALVIREVCGDQCEVVTLVPRGVSEHGWQPGPKDIVKAKDAHAAIAVGLNFDEKWLKVLGVAPKKVLWIGPLLDPMGWWSDDMTGSMQGWSAKSNDTTNDRSNDKAKDKANDKANNRASDRKSDRKRDHHDAHEQHEHHSRLLADPHIWTDAGRMAKAAEISAAHLASIMPASASVFKARARSMSERLIKLQLSVEARRQLWVTRPVVVFHDVAGYFARRFNLPILAVATGSAGHDLSAKMIADVAKRFKDARVAAVMVERSDGAAKNLARELKSTVKQVDFSASSAFKSWDDWYLAMVQAWEDVLQPVGSP